MAKPRSFDAAKYRDNPKAVAAYLNEALLTRDPNLISMAIGDMARAQGMTRFARKAGNAPREPLQILRGHLESCIRYGLQRIDRA
jgi:probable addiction module antidote protein